MTAALVIGGSGGLGGAICRSLAQDWETLIVGYRNGQQRAEAIASEIPGAVTQRCDVGDAAGIAEAINRADAEHGLGTIIFAGGAEIGQPFVSRIEESGWRQVIETELIGFTRVVAAAIPLFRARGGGTLVAVVSVANYSYPPGDALSSVPKAGIEALGRAVAKEEGRYGIRANMVAPGIINAGLGAAFLDTLYTPDIWEQQRKRIALQRFGTGDDIGEAVAFLASDRSRYVTGQTLIVDGGFSL